MSRSLLSVLLAFVLLSLASAQQLSFANNVQLLYAPTTIPINGSVTVTIQWETNYVGAVNVHFDLSDLSRNYSYYGGAMTVVQGPGSGDVMLTAVTTANLNLGDQFQLHAYITPANYSLTAVNGLGDDWMYAWANTYPIAVVTNGVTLTNSMTLLYPPATIPQTGYVTFDVAYTTNLPWYVMLHIDLSDITAGWGWDGGASINVSSPGTGVVQFNISVQNSLNSSLPLKIGDSYDVNMYMTSAADNQLYGTGLDWQHRNFSNTATTVSVAAASYFYNNVYIVNPPTNIPTSGAFSMQVAYSTNFSGQVILHCDLNDKDNNYAPEGGYSVYVTGPGAGIVTMTINISAQVTAALNISHVFSMHTYLLDEATSQATGVYNDYLYALGSNVIYTVASNGYTVGQWDDFIQLLNPPASIPNSGVLFLTVEYESSAQGTVDIKIDLSDDSQNYAWGGGASVTLASPSAGVVTLQFNLINGTQGLLNQFDVWQFHVYSVSIANLTAHSTNPWSYPNAEIYYPVVVSNAPVTNYAYILNPPALLPQTGTITVDLNYVSNLANQTVIHLDVNDLSQDWKWFTGTSVTVNSPSSGTVQLTLTFPASLGLVVGDNLVLQYYLTSIWNSTNNPGNDWQTFQFEDRAYVQVVPAGQFVNLLTPNNPPSQIPSTGNFTIQYQYSTNVTGLVNLHCDVSDVTSGWTYDGGAGFVQVEGPSQGTVVFTVSLQYAANISDNIVLHAYMAPNSFSLANGGTGQDWKGVAYETFNYVQAVPAASWTPYVFYDNLWFFNAPTTIPTSGTLEVVLLYSSSAAISTVLHCDLSDITKNYTWDGGYSVVVPSPGSGSVTCSFPIVSLLAPGDAYQIHGYSVSAANHAAHASVEWQFTNFDVYSPVVVSNTPLTNYVQLLNAPVTIPTIGTVTYELTYTSTFGNQTVLHLDLNDITQDWKWFTGSQIIVPSPGSGTVQITLTFTAAMNLAVGDVYSLKAYMTAIANDTAHPGQDWMYSGYDNYNTVSVAAPGTFINSIAPLYAPTAIPNSGLFTATYQYSTNITGLVDLHLDLSDLGWTYISGSPLAQVSGPSQGTFTFTVNVTTPSSPLALTIGQSYYLHAYMAATSDGLEWTSGNDWQRSRGDSIITVPAALPTAVASSSVPFAISFYQNPGTIPTSGTVEWIVEWSAPAPVACNLHIDLSDTSNNYNWGGGASVTVPTPGRGFRVLQIPIVGILNAGDIWQAHAYITTIANATADPGNDWKHSNIDLYVPVVVSAAPLVNYMSILAPPTTIPTVGTLQLEVFYISACGNSTNLHLDLSDVTQKWLYEAGSMVTVPSPGTGTVILTLSTTAANNMTVGDMFDLHLYFTCQANATANGGNDWQFTSYDNPTTFSVQAALPNTFINSLTPVSRPYYIPNAGNFTIQYKWSCNTSAPMNFHVDLSDLTKGWLYEGGATVQATCPGAGVAPFNIQLPAANITVGDSYELHAYMAPTDTGLIYGSGNDWSHSLYDGFTTVQAVVPGTSGVNSLTFINPVAIIPQTGSFYVTLAYSSNLPTMSNIHIDMSDVTLGWQFEIGSLTQVASPGTGQISVLLTIPSTVTLVPGDLFELHAYMASIANATMYGNSTDWQHSAVDSFSQVTVIAGSLYNQMTILNAPLTIANSGQETFQLIWSSATTDLLNLHCDLSDVTQVYAYEGGSYQQVQGPGSGLLYMTVVMANNMGGGPLTIGDNYTLHCYMTNATTTTAVGGTGNDWKAPQFESFYPMTVASSTTFINYMNVLQVPQFVPTSGNLTLQVAWASNVAGETNLHLDLSDVTNSFSYDGGSMQVVSSPGSGIVTMNILISSAMPLRDQYELHAYMAPTANSTGWGGSGNDWSHAIFQNVWLVNASGSNTVGSSSTGSTVAKSSSSSSAATTGSTMTTKMSSSSSSSVAQQGTGGGVSNSGGSGLSGGSIAGIVIGSVVGVSILIAIIALFLCGGRGGRKGGKLEDAQATGNHKRHLDEPSVSNAPSNIEMGETHSMDDGSVDEA